MTILGGEARLAWDRVCEFLAEPFICAGVLSYEINQKELVITRREVMA